jgi:hypothetical protein
MRSNSWISTLASTAAIVLASVAHGQCPDWASGFHLIDLSPDPLGNRGIAQALAVYDEGSGPALYVGGNFSSAGPVDSRGIDRWDGRSWSTVGDAIEPGVSSNSSVYAFAVFDDGSGPALFAGGTFFKIGAQQVNYIAKWQGSQWQPLAVGMNNDVFALCVFDDGGGPALYAGGYFTTAGGVSANRIAKWNGSSWSPLGSGLNAPVHALAVFDDGAGGGPALYAGGEFTNVAGSGAGYIAKWDGSTWSPVGGGASYIVNALAVFAPAGGATELYAGGYFTTVGGTSANHIARWNGSSWSSVGPSPGLDERVWSLYATHAGASGAPTLYVGGLFDNAGGTPAQSIVAWDGSSWSALGSGFSGVGASAVMFDDGQGAGPTLYAGGGIASDSTVLNGIGRWNGTSWSALNSGKGADSAVDAMTVFDDGQGGGPELYAAGEFTTPGTAIASEIARWNGSSWSALGDPYALVGGGVSGLAVHDDGSGSGNALYATGWFVAFNKVAKWNGSTWSSLGSGLPGGNDDIGGALASFDDGSGTALYLGGGFSSVGGVNTHNVARWDGSSWSAVGGGIGSHYNDFVDAFTVFDDGSGPALYAAGLFTVAGGVGANNIAKWDGSMWSPLGSGLTGSGSGFHYVTALTVWDDGTGSGPALYAAGLFTTAGGNSALNIAKWNGSSWSSLGGGISDGVVYALAAFDDGTGAGSALYVGGSFSIAGAASVKGIARWDGASWSALSGGGVDGVVDPVVIALAVHDDGSGTGPALWLGGSFLRAGGIAANNISEWLRCGSPFTSFCFGDGSLATHCPCSNHGAIGHGCANSQASSLGAMCTASGNTNPDTVVLTASQMLPSALCIFLQGNMNAPSGFVFGDGIRCASGILKRIGVKHAIGGTAHYPEVGDLSISAKSAALGDAFGIGAIRYYQTYYRDPNQTFCPPATFNVTNGMKIQW